VQARRANGGTAVEQSSNSAPRSPARAKAAQAESATTGSPRRPRPSRLSAEPRQKRLKLLDESETRRSQRRRQPRKRAGEVASSDEEVDEEEREERARGEDESAHGDRERGGDGEGGDAEGGAFGSEGDGAEAALARALRDEAGGDDRSASGRSLQDVAEQSGSEGGGGSDGDDAAAREQSENEAEEEEQEEEQEDDGDEEEEAGTDGVSGDDEDDEGGDAPVADGEQVRLRRGDGSNLRDAARELARFSQAAPDESLVAIVERIKQKMSQAPQRRKPRRRDKLSLELRTQFGIAQLPRKKRNAVSSVQAMDAPNMPHDAFVQRFEHARGAGEFLKTGGGDFDRRLCASLVQGALAPSRQGTPSVARVEESQPLLPTLSSLMRAFLPRAGPSPPLPPTGRPAQGAPSSAPAPPHAAAAMNSAPSAALGLNARASSSGSLAPARTPAAAAAAAAAAFVSRSRVGDAMLPLSREPSRTGASLERNPTVLVPQPGAPRTSFLDFAMRAAPVSSPSSSNAAALLLSLDAAGFGGELPRSSFGPAPSLLGPAGVTVQLGRRTGSQNSTEMDFIEAIAQLHH
jgi:hypothetical protein